MCSCPLDNFAADVAKISVSIARVFALPDGKDGITMKWNSLFKSLLKTAVYIMDQTADQVDRASDRASQIADDARSAIFEEDHTFRNVLIFAAGVGVGVGAGMLLAPASGEETRNSIGEKVQDITDRVKGRMSNQNYPATGTE
jgi:hypothetical protein